MKKHSFAYIGTYVGLMMDSKVQSWNSEYLFSTSASS